jgi:hypothetical protein
MPVESPNFDVSMRYLRQIRGVTGDLAARIDSPRSYNPGGLEMAQPASQPDSSAPLNRRDLLRLGATSVDADSRARDDARIWNG